MKLYDIFYSDGTMDCGIPLASAMKEEDARAICGNWDDEPYLIFTDGKWTEGTWKIVDTFNGGEDPIRYKGREQAEIALVEAAEKYRQNNNGTAKCWLAIVPEKYRWRHNGHKFIWS